MKRIKSDALRPGDIILTASPTLLGKGIRLSTGGLVSHAIICVQHSSIIDSTADGVQARNLQRELFNDDESVFAFRAREPLNDVQASRIVEFARSEIGARYSKMEAARSVIGGAKPRNRQQFCSRLVARSYARAGLSLVGDSDYCTPEELRLSPLLIELAGITEVVSDEEIRAWEKRPKPLQAMQTSHNAVLEAGRRLDPTVENFTDLDRLVQEHPEWDAEIAQAYRESGFLDVWRSEFEINPWRYDIEKMSAISRDPARRQIHEYCVDTIREAYSGGFRFAANLKHYTLAFQIARRETTGLLVALYERLVRNDQLRRYTAIEWLRRNFPDDVGRHLERVLPHSELWLSMVDRVEPNLGALARLAMTHEGAAKVCSTCRDPARDYWLVNGADTMPGVPSLRLCDGCARIGRSGGEVLEPFN